VVYMQATETSTAVRHDVEAIAKIVTATDRCWCGWNHRAWARRTRRRRLGNRSADRRLAEGGDDSAGLAYLSVSERAWAAMEKSKNSRLLLRSAQERKNAAKGESAYTPAVALIAPGRGARLHCGQAGGDLEKGRMALIDNAQVKCRATRAGWWRWIHALCADGSSGCGHGGCSAGSMDSGAVVKALKAKFALVTATARERCRKIFRGRIWVLRLPRHCRVSRSDGAHR